MKIFPNKNDSELLIGIKQGDVQCFEQLYRKYKGQIYNFIMKASYGDFYMAEEIVQKVFIKIWEIRNDLVLEGTFSAFLFTISKNMYISMLRKNVQDSIYREYCRNTVSEAEYSVDREVEYKFLEEEINRLIEQLPPARRMVYRMSKKEHLSNREIACKLNISENTVESHLTKASAFLRQMLSVKYVPVYLLIVFI